MEQTIPCPDCGADIPIDTRGLFEGQTFVCLTCEAKITLASQSKPTVKSAMEQFEALKAEMLAAKEGKT